MHWYKCIENWNQYKSSEAYASLQMHWQLGIDAIENYASMQMHWQLCIHANVLIIMHQCKCIDNYALIQMYW